MKYVIGSDAKTVAIAREILARSDEAMRSGDWKKSWEIIETALKTPNQPLRAEIEAAIE